MPESHPAASFVKLFPFEDIPRILQNIQTCCATLSRQTPGEKENDLTKRLYKKLCRFPEYRTGPIVPYPESATVVIDDDEPELTGRADIIFTCGLGLETYFAVEAKRLFVTYPSGKKAPLVMEYINDGMMRYVTGQYASKMTEGAILGYVCDNTVSDARNVLVNAVEKETRQLHLITAAGAWQKSPLGVSPAIDETRHALKHRLFTMYHILTKV
jgi:hypothetical protein